MLAIKKVSTSNIIPRKYTTWLYTYSSLVVTCYIDIR